MANKTVCIEREYGSNGKKVAEWLSKSTGIECYDKESLKKVAKENNLIPEKLAEGEDGEYQIYGEAIKFLADRRSCIFVGTCAAAVLQGKPRNVNVFIKADMESRISWAMGSEKIAREEAAGKIEEMETIRKDYRSNHAVTETGEEVTYDLVVTSSKFGIEGTSEVIRACMTRI